MTQSIAAKIANDLSPLVPDRFRRAFELAHGPNLELADRQLVRDMLDLVYHHNLGYIPFGNGMVMRDCVQTAERFVNLGESAFGQFTPAQGK